MANGPLPLRLVLRYLGVIAVGNLVWEAIQLPLYTLLADGNASLSPFRSASLLGRRSVDRVLFACD